MAELNAVLADGYDRETFELALTKHEALRDVGARLGRLLPHPEHLLCDLYCALFKLNVVLRPAKALSPSVLINRQVLQIVVKNRHLHSLRQRTELDPGMAATGTVLIAERVLNGLKREFQHEPEKLLHALESANDEEALIQRRAEADALERLSQTPGEPNPLDAHELRGELGEEIDELEAKLARDRRRQQAAAKTAAGMGKALNSELEQLPSKLNDAEQHARSLGVGSGSSTDAERRLELGEQIMRSRKLRLLARLVGAFREVAFEARQRRVVRAPQELHAISMGAELERLLPSELLALRPSVAPSAGKGLRLDFLRRYSERKLLQYQLEASAERGPMVVCVDGSGSMRGSKEIWSKAVALTLMEIARREHRACLAIIFSAGDPLFELEFLAKARAGARRHIRDEAVMQFAEHFPGGGTDFEPPLQRAVDAVTAGHYRRGDIVFITDGHAAISEELIRHIAITRKRHQFKIRALLVDVGEHERCAVERFADDIRYITDLTADSVSDMFAAV